MSWANGTEFSPSRMQRLSGSIPATYTVFKDGGTTYAETNMPGGTDYSDTNSHTVIQAALDAIQNYGGSVFIKQLSGGAAYELDDQLVIPNKAAGARYYWIMSDGAELHFLDTVAKDAISLDHSGAAMTYNLRISGLHIYPERKDELYYAIYVNNIHDVRLDNLKIGYNGIKLESTNRSYMDSIEIVDSANEGMYLEDCSYMQLSNTYLDNCGGYGGYAGHNAMFFKTAISRLSINNLRIFGGKASYGGQAFGVYIDNGSRVQINNFQSEGFKEAALDIEGGHWITLNNINIEDADKQGIRLFGANADLYDVTLDNFTIYDCGGVGVNVRAEGTYDAERIEIGNGVINTINDVAGLYNGIGLDDAAGGGISKYVDVHDIHVENANRAFQEQNSSDYNQFQNITYTNCNLRPTYVGAHTKFPTLIVPFVEGTTMLSTMPTGWEIDLAAEYAATAFNLPKDLQAILQIVVYATSIVLEADAMHAEFVINAATDNEAYNTHSVNLADFNSYTTNFAANDNIEWRITDSDSATIGSFAAGDTVLFQVLHEAAGGADCATDAAFHNIHVKYI